MDNLTTRTDDSGTGFPIVPQADSTQLQAGVGPAFTGVESRLVLGCHAGRGTVTIDGRRYPVAPSDLYVLPWGCPIRFDADPTAPFFVYGMHVIPWHSADAPIELTVPHGPGHHLAGAPWRRDLPLWGDGGTDEVIVGTERQRPHLAALARYAVQIGQDGLPGSRVARALGELALIELRKPPVDDTQPAMPPLLSKLLTWIDSHLSEPITLPTLADVARRGTTTINRLFHRHLGTSPMDWVTSRRIEHASRLLSTTDHTIAHIAHDVGVPDPYYFSRLFKQHTGLPPTAWRHARSRP
jgi:AraC family transcriptional regulator, arabinose operon regulatory protein